MSFGKNKISRDKVHIEKQALHAIIGPDCWKRTVPQDCQVSLEMTTDFAKAAQSDELRYSLNYAVISKDIAQFVDPAKNFKSLGKLAEQLLLHVKGRHPGIEHLALKAEAKDVHIRSENVGVVVHTPQLAHKPDELVVSGLKLLTLIGVFTFERLQKQYVTVDIHMPWSIASNSNINHQELIDDVVEFVESSNFKTVEALVECVAQITLQNVYFSQNAEAPVTVKVIKLNAITATQGVGVSCTRFRRDFAGKASLKPISQLNASTVFDLPASQSIRVLTKKSSTAFVAFGSNVGDRIANIQCAIDLLNSHAKVRVQNISSIFESEPMYFQNQRLFLNGCIEVKTELSPDQLLELCKQIEYEELKRVKEFENGPRSIDLDIILYKNGDGESVTITSDKLVVPHPRLIERTFVMEPLCELISPDEIHPVTAEPIYVHLNQLYEQGRAEDILWKVIPLPRMNDEDRFLKFKNKSKRDPFNGRVINATVSPTITMGILNTTPDSFSDGGKFDKGLDLSLSRAESMVKEVLKLNNQVIIDIGGCSTRPNSEQATLDQEIERTIPLIRAIRASKSIPQTRVILSIDTYRSQVAQSAIEAGVDLINDISGGTFDPQMFSVLAKNPTTAYAMSHIRGDIQNMNKLAVYSEEMDNEDALDFIGDQELKGKQLFLIRHIARELAQQYIKAVDVGVRRWQIILDPGIGFAKQANQNLEIIRNLNLLKNYSLLEGANFVNFKNLPVLVGPSRKKFIEHITGETNAAKRDFTTGSVATACVSYGADIIRVHDTANCVKSIKMADAMYRPSE
ncbi:LANO_0G02696g1_1 [Lachancea nothofagi CBS 11611]|uniref:Folic acid synthesis protein fol1 n=1 Tax=Lachancea nothofagi CBS 11611 TaxID=1266666 RepID=A0A1G4KFD2_9SACH|nr:LANO_0G02696g1_1 [Lachancea nothofagi CBS 11611]